VNTQLSNAITAAVLKVAARKAIANDSLAVSLIDLSQAQQLKRGDFRGNELFYPASVVKLFFLAAACMALEDGTIAETPELLSALKNMIVDSSNEATSYVVDVLTDTNSGAELPDEKMALWMQKRRQLNKRFLQLGYKDINICQKTWDDEPYGRDKVFLEADQNNRNYLSANHVSALMEVIVLGKLVGPQRTKFMMELLKRDYTCASDDPDDQSTGFCAKTLSAGARLWSKAGWTSQVRHDAAYIELADGTRLIMVIFTRGYSDDYELIAELVSAVSCMDTKTADKTIAPYGSWTSPITTDLIVGKTINFDMIGVDRAASDAADVYYLEVRPQEDGHYVLVRCRNGVCDDIISREFNARTRVHEYGGGSFCVSRGTVYFSNYYDQRLYMLQPDLPGSKPQAVTVEPSVPGGLRYADMLADTRRNCLYCVCEEHSNNGSEPKNYLARIALPASVAPSPAAPAAPTVPVPIAQGHSFYASPMLSPDSKKLAFLVWDHPNMPWDATTLMVAAVTEDGDLTDLQPITSGVNESVFQPQWGPDGALYYVCDKTGWWNLYRYDGVKHEPLCPLNAEFGQAQWRFGLSTYDFHGSNEIICAVNHGGIWKLHRLDLQTKQFSEISSIHTDIQWLRVVGDNVIFRGASTERPQEIVQLDLLNNQMTVLKASVSEEPLTDITNKDIVSSPVPIEFPTTGNRSAHAFYYSPKNPDCEAAAEDKPPLIVKCHGGPNGSASSMFNLEIQYWTSRGFAVVDVNYGGSTGYGREYRQRLDGQWGIVDVNDAVNAALYLVSQGLADKNKLLITGRSAGGFTVLCALTFKDVFAAGASYYGISDIEALAKDTHKFESRYDHTLIGPYPEGRQLYKDRSAIYHTEKLNTPIVFFQGTEDKVVLPDQTIKMLEALKKKKIPCAVIMFEGERHGFSKAETVKQCLEGELYFYLRILGLPIPESLPQLTIFNEESLIRSK
jgi:dipeptidyl aminopeptidase/acylaminoacyl peptidase